jgi:hypothetical protein
MKLLYCCFCGDIFNLTMKEKSCGCGNIKGNYLEDGLNAEWSGGIGTPFMINSNDFRKAIKEHNGNPAAQIEIPIRACTIPYECQTLKIKEPPCQN